MNAETPKTPSGSIVPFGLRMQPELKSALENSAVENGRSLNAEIVARLEKSLLEQNEIAATLESHGEAINLYDDTLSNHERRIEQLESWVSDLRDIQGLGGVGRD